MCLAQKIALAAHGDQKYGGNPYSYHLEAVVGLLREYSLAQLEDAAWLHDVLEDSNTSFFDLIEAGVDLDTAYVVSLVTKGLEGSNEEYFRQVSLSEAAVQLKLADRMCNVLESRSNAPSLFKKYRKEFRVFFKYCYSPHYSPTTKRMWKDLAELFV